MLHTLEKENETFITDGFVYIPAGETLIGSSGDSFAEQPVHPVFVSAFWCTQTCVTNREFSEFILDSGYKTTAEKSGGLRCVRNGRRGTYPVSWRHFTDERWDHPVVGVSWFDAEAYCHWLIRKTGLPYRLPTEAEWEKAARGGLRQAAFPWGDAPAESLGANFGHLGDSDMPRTVPVTALPRNGYGLYVGGNTWEWVQDWFNEDYYKVSPWKDPTGPETGIFKVRRGGAFNNRRSFRLRVSSRNRLEPHKAFLNMSFRVVRSVVPQDELGVRQGKFDNPTAVAFDREHGNTLSFTVPSESRWEEEIQESLQGKATLREQIEAILNVLRPNMEEDEGGVRLVAVEGEIAYLQMIGTCHNCPKSSMTFSDIASTISRHLPILKRVERITS